MKIRHTLLILTAFLLLAIGGGGLWFLLVSTGALRPDPVVEILPRGGTNGTLRVVTDDDYWPYSFYDADGKLSGREVELVNAIANHLGMNVVLRGMKWEQCLDLAVQHDVDLVLTCAEYASGREAGDLVSSLPLDCDDYMVFGKDPIGSVQELRGRRLAQLNYGNVNPTLYAAGFGHEMKLYPSHREVFAAIERGEADYTIIRYTPAVGILRGLGISDIRPQCFAGRSFFCIGIDRHRGDLVRKVNEAIMVLRMNGEMHRLSEKWLTTYVRPMSFGDAAVAYPAVFAFFAGLLVLVAALLIVIGFRHVRSSEQELQAQETQSRALQEALDVITEERNRFAVVRDLINAAHWSFTLDRDYEIIDAGFYGDVGKVLNIDLKITPHAWETILHPDDRENAVRAFRAAIEDPDGRTPYDVNYRMRDRFGNYNWFRSAGKIIRRKDGTREFFGIHININRMVEQEAEHERQLEVALSRANEANRAKTAFLANMSHDIRTPMNAIIGFSDIARRHLGEPGKVDECLGKVQLAGAGLLEIINDILDLAKIESSAIEIKESPTRLSRLLEYVNTLTLSRAEARRQTFTCEMKDIRDDVCWIDQPHLNRIIMNLLTNAVKYTPEGGRIRMRVTQLPDRKEGFATYRFTVEDNGMGMSEEYQKHLFERFTREKNSTVSGIQGTGIGMAITKTLTDALGGTIEFRSKVGEGTVFALTFDFRRRNPGDEGAADEVMPGGGWPPGFSESSAATPSADPEIRVPGKVKRLLLVEDNEINREIALEILKEQGFEVDTAVNGAEAVESVKSKMKNGKCGYDLVLMDIMMPVMNGLEATRAMRAQGISIPIIALSANAFAEDRAVSMAAGMDEHITKPIKVAELMSVIARFS